MLDTSYIIKLHSSSAWSSCSLRHSMHHQALSCILVALVLGLVNPLSTTSSRASAKIQGAQWTQQVATPKVAAIDEIVGWNPAFYGTFLSNYFQKKPLLIRNAVCGLPLKLDLQLSDYIELSGDEDVETRIFQTEKGKIKKYYGPFEPTDIEKHMAKPGWSLLVQEMDRHVPQVADLWSSCFPFLPTWRRDDIMFSLSAPGGSIGAHVDNYDVFLLQGSGRRRWSIENAFLTEKQEKKRAVHNSMTKLLRDFSADQAVELEAGDMLYLPPRMPHEGTTVGDELGTTISFGFRAPDIRSLSTALWDEITSTVPAERAFYQDGADLDAVPANAGRIADRAVRSIASRVQSMLTEQLADGEGFSDWLGKQVTDPLRRRLRGPVPFFLSPSPSGAAVSTAQGPSVAVSDDEPADLLPYAVRSRHNVAVKNTFPSAEAVLRAVLAGECTLRRAEGVRVAYIGVTIFINGEAYALPSSLGCSAAQLGAALCDDHRITLAQLQQLLGSAGLSPHSKQCRFLADLLEEGLIYPARP